MLGAAPDRLTTAVDGLRTRRCPHILAYQRAILEARIMDQPQHAVPESRIANVARSSPQRPRLKHHDLLLLATRRLCCGAGTGEINYDAERSSNGSVAGFTGSRTSCKLHKWMMTLEAPGGHDDMACLMVDFEQ